MSSPMRSFEKRYMKRAGLKKFTTIAGHDDAGEPIVVSVVADREGNIYGPNWPRRVPRNIVAPVRGLDLEARLYREAHRFNRSLKEA